MVIYHEVDSSSLGSILSQGIKRASRGSKGDDELIMKTDTLLDDTIPKKLKEAGVSRHSSVYGYIGTTTTMIDIKNGLRIPLKEKQADALHTLLKIAVNKDKCYVSNLDDYDCVKQAIKDNKGTATLKRLAARYWLTTSPLRMFSIGMVERPEVMITYDIPPTDITVIR